MNKADEEPFLCLIPIDFAALMSHGTRDEGHGALSRLSACPTPFPNLLITHDRKRDCGTGKGEGTSTILRALSSPLALYLTPLSVRPSVRPDVATAYGAVRVPRKNYLWHCFGARLGCHKISQCARLGRARGLCFRNSTQRTRQRTEQPDKAGDGGINH